MCIYIYTYTFALQFISFMQIHNARLQLPTGFTPNFKLSPKNVKPKPQNTNLETVNPQTVNP